MLVQLWGGQRDGETFDLDDPPLELWMAPLEPLDGSGHPPSVIQALVYEMTEELTRDGSIRFRFSKEILKHPADPDRGSFPAGTDI